MLISIIAGAVLGGAAALLARARLNALGFLTWIGWLLVGTGVPVLAGQLAFLALAGEAGEPESAMAVFLLAGGFCAGLSWAVVAAGLRLTRKPA